LEACRADESIVDAPPFILETLSPSNGRSKIARQRLAAFSGGGREFWIVDPNSRTMEAFALGKPSRVYGEGEEIAMSALPGAKFPVGELFRD
jgi:Uma2 family endonuclease